MADEKVVYRTRLHWVSFVAPVIWLVLAQTLRSAGSMELGITATVIGVLVGIAALISYFTSEFGVTDRRLLAKTGFIRRDSTEVMLSRVESLRVNQGILGRLLGFGSVTVGGTGGTSAPLRRVAAPITLRRHVYQQIERLQNNQATAMSDER